MEGLYVPQPELDNAPEDVVLAHTVSVVITPSPVCAEIASLLP